jgi:hypothetical protein
MAARDHGETLHPSRTLPGTDLRRHSRYRADDAADAHLPAVVFLGLTVCCRLRCRVDPAPAPRNHPRLAITRATPKSAACHETIRVDDTVAMSAYCQPGTSMSMRFRYRRLLRTPHFHLACGAGVRAACQTNRSWRIRATPPSPRSGATGAGVSCAAATARATALDRQ